MNKEEKLKPSEHRMILRLLMILVFSIFFVELMIMFSLNYFFEIGPVSETIVDSLLLIIILFPLLYLLVFRPLRQEITRRKKTEDALRKANDLNEALLATIPFGIDIVDAEGNILFMNQRFKAIFDSETIDKKCWKLYRDNREQCLNCPLKKGVKLGEVAVVESGNCLDGKTFLITHTGMIYKDKEAVLEIFQDVTQRKRLESELEKHRKHLEQLVEERTAELKQSQLQLIQSEKMKVIGTMASGIVHDVKNPLGIIVQGINYLETKYPMDDKSTFETMQMIKDNIARADKIAQSLLDFSRASELTLKPQDINSILETSLTLIKHRVDLKKLKIIKELGEGLPKALVDNGKMEQVFVNLFMNAGHAMPYGGKLTIRSYLMQLNKIGNRVGNRAGDCFKLGEKAIVIEIEDTGTGISEDNLKKIFDPFFTTKEVGKGTGLGLSIVKQIIDLHKGLIEVESKVGSDTKFTITLKIAEV